MAIRLSGMNSGLDTDAIVTALVSGYKTKVDKQKKAQTKLSWQQDAWKNINSKVYSLYSSVDKLRYSSAYNKKTTSVSDTTKAKVTASANSVNGTQTLSVDKLAKAGYLTGGKLTTKSGEPLTANTKLSDLVSTNSDGSKNEFSTGGTINVNIGGKETAITLSADMTASQLTSKLKDAGLNANFDAANGRFFVSSPDSGTSNEFSLTANDSAGMASLKSLGLFDGTDSAAKDTYKKWADYAGLSDSDPKMKALLDAEYDKKKISYESRANSYVKAYNDAKSAVDKLNDKYGDYDSLKNSIGDAKQKVEDARNKLDTYNTNPDYAEALKEDPNDPDKITGYKYNTDKMKEDGVYEDFQKAQDELKKAESEVKTLENDEASYMKNAGIMSDNTDNVIIADDGTAKSVLTDENSAAYSKVIGEVDSENAAIRTQTDAATKARIADSKAMYDSLGSGTQIEGVKRVAGQDAQITLNGAVFTSTGNTFNVNGLTIEATAETNGQEISITTSNDTQAVYDMIKDFVGQYNSIINELNSLYNAESAKGYDPLTDEEKDAMSDTEVEKWEKKIKDSLLRRDGTLGGVMNAMTSAMSSVYEVNGKKYSLGSFGINTLGLLNAEKNKQYAFHIDGDSDDSVSGSKPDKLMAAIASDPDGVTDFFKQLTDGLYKSIDKKMKSTSLSSAYTLYNDKEMASEYSDYTKTIKKWEIKLQDMETSYYKKFAAMEKSLATLNSNSSALTGLLGS